MEKAEMNGKKIGILAIIIVLASAAVLYFNPMNKTSEKVTSQKPYVSVSTFSLLEVVRAVGGEYIEVSSIVPLGSDAHMFSPNPQQVATLAKSDLFIYNGAGFESWAQNIAHTLPESTTIIDMSGFVSLHTNTSHEEEHDHADEDQHDEHDHGAYDPHYWLDIDNMIKMTQKVEQALSNLIPVHKENFAANARAYIAQLNQLKSEYETGLKECKNRTLVSNHDAFGYLSRSNHLENISIIGLSSDEQPSAKTVAHVTEVVREHGIKTIFFEELINDNIAQTIAKETGASAVSLQPLENISEDELKSHQTYLTIMRENLKKLKTAMECR